MAKDRTSYETPQKLTIYIGDEVKQFWMFKSLPTLRELQRHNPAIVRAQDKLRPLLEKNLVAGVIDLEWQQRYDYLHQRGSGLDPVLAKLLAQYNVMVLVNINAFYQLDQKSQAIALGRILQNKKLAKKFGFSMYALVKDDIYRIYSIDNYF